MQRMHRVWSPCPSAKIVPTETLLKIYCIMWCISNRVNPRTTDLIVPIKPLRNSKYLWHCIANVLIFSNVQFIHRQIWRGDRDDRPFRRRRSRHIAAVLDSSQHSVRLHGDLVAGACDHVPGWVPAILPPIPQWVNQVHACHNAKSPILHSGVRFHGRLASRCFERCRYDRIDTSWCVYLGRPNISRKLTFILRISCRF